MAYNLTRYDVPITDTSDQMDIDFIIASDDRKVIHGVVRNECGHIVEGAIVKFFKRTGPCPCDIEPIGHAITDDCGQFLIGPFPPGVTIIIKIFKLDTGIVSGTNTGSVSTNTIDP